MTANDGSIAPQALKARLDIGDPVAVLDVRAASEYEAWRIEGGGVMHANVPYFEFLDGVDDDLLARIPEGDEVVIVCAKGEASAMVAGELRDHGVPAVNLEDGMNGWASIYEAEEVPTPGPATVVQYSRPSSGCLAYLVIDGNEAAVIDPLRTFAERYEVDAAERGAAITYAIDTHIHADHVSGLRAVRDRTGADAVVGEAVAARGIRYDVTTVTDGERLTVGGVELEAVHAPGHTTGMTAYRLGDDALFSGDALFLNGVPRPDLEAGDDGASDLAERLHETLHGRLLELPDDCVVCPGHVTADTTPPFLATMDELRSRLGVLSLSRDAFVDAVTTDMPPRPANFEEIIAINLGERDVSEDEAFRLELGPNNCAVA